MSLFVTSVRNDLKDWNATVFTNGHEVALI